MKKRMTIDVDETTAVKMFYEGIKTNEPSKKIAERVVIDYFKSKKMPVDPDSPEDAAHGLDETQRRISEGNFDKSEDDDEGPLI